MSCASAVSNHRLTFLIFRVVYDCPSCKARLALTMQDRRREVWSGRSTCVNTLQVGGSEGMPPLTFYFKAMRLRLRPFWANTMLLEGQTTELYM